MAKPVPKKKPTSAARAKATVATLEDDARQGLAQAKALVERGWTQCANARDAAGVEVAPHNDEATCWCTIGAFGRVFDGRASRSLALNTLIRVVKDHESHPVNIISFNDATVRTQAEVLAVFDAAIASIGEKP